MRLTRIASALIMMLSAAIASPVFAEEPGSYLNYDVRATGGAFTSAGASVTYGKPVGNGVGTVRLDALSSISAPRIFLGEAAWQIQDPRHDWTLRAGEGMSIFSDFGILYFDGVQWSSNEIDPRLLPVRSTAFSYAFGWERPDPLAISTTHEGFVVDAMASRGITDRFTAQAHIFADSGAKMFGARGTWQLGTSRAKAARLSASFETRIDRDENLDFFLEQAALAPTIVFTRPRIRAALDFRLPSTRGVRISYAAGTASRAFALDYDVPVGPAQLTVSFLNSVTGGYGIRGITTSLSFPLGSKTTFSHLQDIEPGSSSSIASLQRSIAPSDIGTGYDLTVGSGDNRYLDASFVWQAPSTVSHFQLSRFGDIAYWQADVSGAMLFLNGAQHVAQSIDPAGALLALHRRRIVTVRLVAANGFAIAPGSVVSSTSSAARWKVSSNGRLELSGVDPGPLSLTVETPRGRCSSTVTIAFASRDPTDLGTHVCRQKS